MVHSLTVRLLPEGFSRVRKRTLALLIAVFVIIAGAILVAISDAVARMWWIAPVVLCMLAYAVGSACFNLVRRQQQEWDSFRLTLDNEKIVREISHHPTVSIRRSDIAAVEEMPTGAIVVKTPDKDWCIYIPPEIERRDEVRRLLALEAPVIEPHKPTFTMRYRVPLLLVWAGMLVLFLSSRSPFVEIPAGVVIVGVLIYAHIQTRKNRMLSGKNVVKLWFVIFCTVLVLVKMAASLGVVFTPAR